MGTRRFNLVEVANVNLLPPNIQMVAALDYSGITPPANLRQIGATWGSLGTAWPGRGIQVGAVRYVAGVVTPAQLLPVAAVVPDISIDEASDRVKDTFTRADSALTLGNAETGQAWSALGGTWGISSNQAYAVNDGNDFYAVAESGLPDPIVEVTYAVVADTQRLVFRASDVNNLWIISNQSGAWKLLKRVTGAYTQVSTDYTAASANGDIVRVILRGATISVYINGTLRIGPVADSFNPTATHHGIGHAVMGGTAARWDNFRVLEVAII